MVFWYFVAFLGLGMLLINSFLTKSARLGRFAWLLSFLIFGFLAIFLATRGDMGVDWAPYTEAYALIPSFFSLITKNAWLPFNLEPGFQVFISILKLFELHHNLIPTVLFVVSYLMLMYGCKRWNTPPLPMTAIITLLVYPNYYGQIRMAFVYTIGVLIGLSVVNRSNKHLFQLSLLSASVQYIGIAYLMAVFLKPRFLNLLIFRPLNIIHYTSFRVRLATVFFCLSLVFACIPFSQSILNSIITVVSIGSNPLSDKLYSYYMRVADVDQSNLGLFLLVAFASMLILFSNRESTTRRTTVFAAGVGFFAAALILTISSTFPILSHRAVSMMVIPSTAILISSVSLRSKANFLLYILLVFYSLSSFFRVSYAIGPYISIDGQSFP
jgi:hypothetical protein